MLADIDLEKYTRLADKSYYRKLGRVTKVVGLSIESAGPDAKLNDLCRIIPRDNPDKAIYAEVVGFKEKRILLMPFESVEGIAPGCIVENTGKPLMIKVGPELLGKSLDGLGNPTDGSSFNYTYEYPCEAAPPDPMEREIISEVLPLGVKAGDGLITVGKGQRIGRYAGSGGRCERISWNVSEEDDLVYR